MATQTHTLRPAVEREQPGRTAVIVGASAAVLLGLLFGIGALVGRLVEFAGWVAGG